MSRHRLKVLQNEIEWPGHLRELERVDQQARVTDFSPAAAAHETAELLAERPTAPLRLLLERPERSEIAVRRDDALHGVAPQSANQFVLEIGLADVEAERLHAFACDLCAEGAALEPAAELAFLAGVAEPRERQTEPTRPVEVERAADRLRAADRHDGDAFGGEVAAAARGQRLERDAVADPFDEDDGARVGVDLESVFGGGHSSHLHKRLEQ